jgi:hypothetical protein
LNASPETHNAPTPDAPAGDDRLSPGVRVTVTQQVQHKGWRTAVTGVVEAVEQRKTGSWFAHAKDDRLWLDRLVLRKDDGEIVVCNLDRYSRVDVVGDAAAGNDDGRPPTGDLSAGATHAGPGSHPAAAKVHGIAEGALDEE